MKLFYTSAVLAAVATANLDQVKDQAKSFLQGLGLSVSNDQLKTIDAGLKGLLAQGADKGQDLINEWNYNQNNREYEAAQNVDQLVNKIYGVSSQLQQMNVGDMNVGNLQKAGIKNIKKNINKIGNPELKKLAQNVWRPIVGTAKRQPEFKAAGQKNFMQVFNEAKSKAMEQQANGEALLAKAEQSAPGILNQAFYECSQFTNENCQHYYNVAKQNVEQYAKIANVDQTIAFAKEQANKLKNAAQYAVNL